jgi:hypothetical protein
MLAALEMNAVDEIAERDATREDEAHERMPQIPRNESQL